MRQLEQIDAILKLARNGKGLRDFVTKKLPKIRKAVQQGSRSGYDKHIDGFFRNEDAIQSVNLKLCYKSFTGSYGDSSTYSDIADLDNGITAEYLAKYLNKHKDEILLEMADMMVSDARQKRDVAIDEIESLKASLKILLDIDTATNTPQ